MSRNGTARLLRPRLLSLILLSTTAITGSAQPLGVGTINTQTGEPLSHVWVQEIGSWNGSLTKGDGIFLFHIGTPVTLMFAKDGFRPQVREVTGTDNELNVVMTPAAGRSARLGDCNRRSDVTFPEIRVAKTHGILLKRETGTDFVGYTATYRSKRVAAVLSSMTGIHVAGLTPTPTWAEGLSRFTVGSLTCGGVQWIDLRGFSGEGLESRWIGYGLGHLEYSKAPAEAARAFDSAIERGCCPKHLPPSGAPPAAGAGVVAGLSAR
jgi:hypothetical protein